MNGMGLYFDESIFKKTAFREKEDGLEVARVQHQVGFSLVAGGEKITVKQVTSWCLLVVLKTVMFILMYEEKVDCGGFNI